MAAAAAQKDMGWMKVGKIAKKPKLVRALTLAFLPGYCSVGRRSCPWRARACTYLSCRPADVAWLTYQAPEGAGRAAAALARPGHIRARSLSHPHMRAHLDSVLLRL